MTKAPPPSFVTLFDQAPEVVGRAAGRVNLIGEHTDYNDGWVLPTLIPQTTQVELRRRGDRTVRAFSVAASPSHEIAQFSVDDEARTGGWLDYLKGVIYVLRRARHVVSGFEVRIDSTVPLGSGLSSSAALDVSLLRAIREAYSLALTSLDLALLAQKVETDFVGVPVGVMDPMACSLAEPGSALLIDTRSLQFEQLPLPRSIELIVINSGVVHRNASSGYKQRRQECLRAATALGVTSLRDLETSAAASRVESLPSPLDRRIRHVLTENERVRAMLEAFRREDGEGAGRLLNASHRSLREDFEVSVPEIDLLTDLARSDPDVLGARLTGGGFGGSILAFARAGTGTRAARSIASAYESRNRLKATVLVPA